MRGLAEDAEQTSVHGTGSQELARELVVDSV
jgi:hypothetical protein